MSRIVSVFAPGREPRPEPSPPPSELAPPPRRRVEVRGAPPRPPTAVEVAPVSPSSSAPSSSTTEPARTSTSPPRSPLRADHLATALRRAGIASARWERHGGGWGLSVDEHEAEAARRVLGQHTTTSTTPSPRSRR